MPHRNSFEEDYEFEVLKNDQGGYSVSLPHQCDDWEIVGAQVDNDFGNIKSDIYTDDYPNLPKSKELAVKQMELFVKRAQEALEKLKLLTNQKE